MPTGLNHVVSIATGGHHVLALRNDGTVVAWGQDDIGESTVPPGLSEVIAVSPGSGHNLVLMEDGTIGAWGLNDHGQSLIPPGLAKVSAVAAGANHSLALVEVLQAGRTLRLTWPIWATDYRLEWTLDPSRPDSWTAEPGAASVVDSEHVFTTEFSGNGRFFRLEQQ